MAESWSWSWSSASSKGSSTAAAVSSSTLYGRRKLKEEAEAELFKARTETEALEHLYLTKPAYLAQDGSDVWIDQKHVDAKMTAIILRLKVHSFPERAERLAYLQSVLKQKWVNKPETYKAMLTFLTEMYDPTKNPHLVVKTTEYSTTVEEDGDNTELILYGEELRQAEIKKEEFRQTVVNELLEDRLHVSYSSEEELSDWGSSPPSEDEEEAFKANPVASTPKVEPLQPKAESGPTEAEARDRARRFWEDESLKSNFNIKTHLRRVQAVPLTDQPVISSLTALNARFGEHWEWKKASALNQRPHIKFLSEGDIVQELIWQFLSPSNRDSPLFTENWALRSEISVKSLSHSALASFIADYGSLFSKLQKMKQFIRICSTVELFPPIFRTYAHALSNVLFYVTRDLDGIERSLKIKSDSDTRRPTTLLQLHALLQSIIQSITALERLHSQAISTDESVPNWLKALKLISCLERELTLVSCPRHYGLVLYIFAQCLSIALDVILRPLEMSDWSFQEFLFKRSSAKIADSVFWTDVIVPQEIEAEFASLKLRPLSFLEWIMPKVLTMLKVQEIINQIGTEMGLTSYQVLKRPLPPFKALVNEFVDELLERDKMAPIQNSPREDSNLKRRELEGHLAYLGLQNSTISGAFVTVLDNSLNEAKNPTKRLNFETVCNEIEEFVQLDRVPLMQANHALRSVLEKHMEPYFSAGQRSLNELFQRYDTPGTIRLVQEIVFGGKEEFALECIRLGYQTKVYEQMGQLEEAENPNTKFQAILNCIYPEEDRTSFEIEFALEPNSNTANFGLRILPQFPLTLLLTPKTITRYEFVGKEIFKIRKALWILIRLNIKHCKAATDVETRQLLLLRFAMIHFWSSFRSFVLFSVFNDNGVTNYTLTESSDINQMLKVCEDASGAWPLYRILSLKLMDPMIIKPMLHSSLLLGKKWKSGVSVLEVTTLGLRVKRAWELILELGSSSYSAEMNQIAQFFGPLPEGIF